MAIKPLIYLDLDGVCCDFHYGAAAIHKATDYYNTWKKGDQRRWSEVLGITEEEFWRPITEAGAKFWMDLPEFSWFPALYRRLQGVGEVVFLTSPSQDPMSSAGKVLWLQARLGRHFQNYILTSRKDLLAYPAGHRDRRCALVDDTPRVCEAFAKAGGLVVMFPAPHNNVPMPIAKEVAPYIAAKVHCTIAGASAF